MITIRFGLVNGFTVCYIDKSKEHVDKQHRLHQYMDMPSHNHLFGLCKASTHRIPHGIKHFPKTELRKLELFRIVGNKCSNDSETDTLSPGNDEP